MAESMGDAQYTAILGPKCPDCGWRSTAEQPTHRPFSAAFEACPHWTPADAGTDVPDDGPVADAVSGVEDGSSAA